MSQVVIGDILPYTQAFAILNQTVFGTNWTANFESDVVVYVTPTGDDPDDATQILSYPSDFSVSFIGGLEQVQVTLVTPSAAGDIVTITRQTPADRENLYTNTNFTPSMLNNDFGILTLVDQQAQLVDQKIGPRYNYSAIIVDVVDTILPILGANQFWGKNASDTAIVAINVSDIIGGLTEVDTGTGLTGGPITSTGTISFAAIPANTLWINITSGTAVPTQVSTSYFLKSASNLSDLASVPTAVANLGLTIGVNVQAYSPNLTSIAALSGATNTIPFFASTNTYGTIAAAASSVLITSAGSVPSLSQTLPLAVQVNITELGSQAIALNMNSHQINNVTDPTNPQDAATKAYVDSGGGAFLPLAGGTMSGIINMGNHKITNLTDPSSAQDAVTLNYLNNTALALYLPLAGGTMTGIINMGSHKITNVTDPTNPQDAATKAYVDSGGGAFLPLAGGTMSGIINMGNHKITNMTDPSSAQDAVTLNYLTTTLALYLPLAGGTMTGVINMNSHKITNLTDPTNPQDAATKNYVDSVAVGLTVQAAVYAASTVALTVTYSNGASGIGATLTNAGAQATFAIDGVTPPVNSRILIKNQSSTFQNGIYDLTNVGSGATNWILTRSTDYDQPSEIQPGDLVIVNNGTANGGASWIETASVSAIGTDPILFSQFTFSATSVLLKALNLSDVANTVTAFNNISPLTTKGDLIGFSTQNIRVAVGGTNAQILQVDSAATAGISWSTATYPVTTTVSQLLYSSSTNTVVGLATVNGGVLGTSNTGVPTWIANPAASGKVLQSVNGAISAWSTPTYPSTSGTAGKMIVSDGTNNVYSTPTFPNASATSGKIIVSDGTNWIASTPTFPNASASAGKIIISDGTNWIASTPTYPNTSGTAGKVVISDGTNNIYSTPTFPNASATLNKVIISDGTNWIASASTLTLGGNFTTSGAFTTTLTVTGNTNVTLPTSGTLLTSATVVTGVAIQRITATGAFTYTRNANTLFATFELLGAGASGGGAASSAANAAIASSGGGGGKLTISATAAQIDAGAVTGSIGALGAAPTAGNNNGNDGGDSTIIFNASTWTAGGGKKGTGSATITTNQNLAGGVGGTNTTGSNASLVESTPGQLGGRGWIAIAQSIYGNNAGGNAAEAMGWGGSGLIVTVAGANAGNAGTGNGSGGSGGTVVATASNVAGGPGTNGILIITEYLHS